MKGGKHVEACHRIPLFVASLVGVDTSRNYQLFFGRLAQQTMYANTKRPVGEIRERRKDD
jgi:hypothetical protein